MPSAETSNSVKQSPEDQIKILTVGLRETIMEYFKGDCIKRLTYNKAIKCRAVSRSLRYEYQRRSNEAKQETIISIGNSPVVTVERFPDKITLHSGVLNRSPQLREVSRQLQEFIKTYLAGVQVELNDGSVKYA